jgi:hypothetical protein
MADFYGTLEGANTYHSDRGNTTWTGDDPTLNIALLRGSEYIDQGYGLQFPGSKVGLRAQIREWPRNGAQDTEGNAIGVSEVPVEAMYASYEAALRELTVPGSLQPDYDPAGQQKSVKVDVIAIEYTAAHGAQSVIPIINIINGILAPILTGGGINTGLAGRAART